MRRLIEILLLSAAVTSLMGADEGNARYERLGSKIMCTCGCDQMLLKCNHVGCPNSDRMIRELHALTGTGQLAAIQPEVDDQAVLNWFRRTWGVTAVVEPGTRGFELWAWIMPAVAVLLGVLVVVVTLRKWRLRRSQQVRLDPHLETFRNRARRETEI